MTTIPNPYANKDTVTFTTRVSKEDAEFLFGSNLPRQGSRQAVVASLINALVSHLRDDPKFTKQQLTQEQYVTELIERIRFK